MTTNDGRLIEASRIPGMIVQDLATYLCEESIAFDGDQSPFRADIVPGDPRLTLVVGGNATGKSIMHKMLVGLAHAHGIEPISLSIRERTGSNESPGSMRRQFMYGYEHRDSTGNTSVRTTRKAFETLAGRSAPAMVLLDEPEMGLSDGFAHAFGELIGRLAADPPPVGCGVMVVSHSRALVRGLMAGLGAVPGYVITGGGPANVAEWLDYVEVRTVEDLEALGEISSSRRQTTREVLGF